MKYGNKRFLIVTLLEKANMNVRVNLYLEGIRSGLINLLYIPRDLLRNDWVGLKRTAKVLVCPVDLWRYVEFPFILSHLGKQNNASQDILDISSPKLLSLYIAQKFNCNITATDIVPRTIDEVNWYKRANSKKNLWGKIEDAKRLSFADETFSIVYSVSVLEHIGNDSDIKAIKEMARVLKPGGKLLITVPLVTTYTEEWKERDVFGCQVRSSDRNVFFSRYYDVNSLQSRLIGPSGLRLLQIRAWQETTPGWYGDKYLPNISKLPTKIFVKLLDYFYSNKTASRNYCKGTCKSWMCWNCIGKT